MWRESNSRKDHRELAVYHLTKLRILKIYCDLVDEYIDRKNCLIQIATGSLCTAPSLVFSDR